MREMGLVGIAGAGGSLGELLSSASGGERALEAQDASQPLGPVADGRLEASP